jgi:DNA polymerase-3 subunit chi
VTTIDFYFNAPDPLQIACRLAAKAMTEGKRMLIYAPDPEVSAKLDKLMWTWPAVGFVPHVAADDPLAPDTPVLISRGDDTPAQCPVLLNLSNQSPPHFASFERLLEIVGIEDADKQAGRERYKLYKSRGYAIANHDLAPSDG